VPIKKLVFSDKRLFFLLLFLTLVLPACQGSSPESEPAAVSSLASEVQLAVASDDFEVGKSRLPIVLYAGTERGAPAKKVSLMALDLSTDPPSQGWEGEAINYEDYWIPYWVAYPQLPQAGYWGFRALITMEDGSQEQAQFTVQVMEHSSSPAVGSEAPASQNRTLKTEPDIHNLSSGAEPNPGLYEMTVAEAISSGRPTVVVLATPGFCTSQLCAPVVDSVEAVYPEFKDRVNFIHLEIYKDFDPLVESDEVKEWKLTSEPWTFVLDRQGKVAAKFGGPLGSKELTESLSSLLP
jgi:hypothetical protein